jgi:hypothetical protein
MSMQRIFPLALIAFAVLAIRAQQDDGRKMVVWSADKACGFKSRSITQNDILSCERVVTGRGPVNVISHNGIEIVAGFAEDDDFLVAAAVLSNKTAEPIMFDADLWFAAHFKNKTAADGEKPILAETSVPSRDIVRNMRATAARADAAGSFIPEGQMTTEVREIRQPDWSKYPSIAIVSADAAQHAAAERRKILSRLSEVQQQRIRDTALITKTIPAKGFVKGLIYFRRVKKAEFVVVSMDILDTKYIFQVPMPGK